MSRRLLRSILALGIGLIAAAALSPPAAAQRPDTAASSAVSGSLLLQFNMCGGADCAGSDAAKVAAITTAVTGGEPVAVSLNEICAQQYDALLAALRSSGYAMNGEFAETFPAGHGRCGGHAFGNAVLSRAPLSAASRTVFASQTAGVEQRALLCVRTTLEVVVQVCSTHLAPGNAQASVRAAQVAQVVKELRTVADPVVVMGDFNEYPAADMLDQVYASAYGGGAYGAYLEAGSTRAGDPCRCGPPTRAGVKLDYVFDEAAEPTAGDSWVTDAAYSDHDFLWTMLPARATRQRQSVG